MPTAFILYSRSDRWKTMPAFMYVQLSALGVLFNALIDGTYVGERVQMGPPPKATD